MQPALGPAQPADDPLKKDQIKKMAAILAGMIPPAARVSLAWAERLYEHGLRFHPEFSDKAAEQTPTQQSYTPEVAEEARARAFSTLDQMAQQFPHLRPILDIVKNAKTPEEQAAALVRMREQTQPGVLEEAMAQMGKLGDNTQ